MQLFPRSLNKLPLLLALGAAPAGVLPLVIWYYWSPAHLQAGYAPDQPVPYSHKLHVDELGMDCRYCHSNIERSHEAQVPPTQTCMGCHSLVKPDSPKLQRVRDSWGSDMPVEWVRVHKLPDHVFFDHSAHLAAGVGCVNCHGRVDQMEVVRLDEPISMGWCLDCHRDPEPNLRPKTEITNMTWESGEGEALAQADVNPPTHCSGCHR